MPEEEKKVLGGLVAVEDLKLVAEQCSESVYNHVLYPAAQKLVADSANKWDDAALALFDQFARDILNSISPKDGD